MIPSAWRSSRLAAALFAVAMLFQAVVMRRMITYYDEDLELYDAEQVLHHHLPYRDFWTMYGPAQSYTLAAFFKIFGISVLTGRLLDALVKAGIACLCFMLVERPSTRRAALAAFASALLGLTCTTSAIYNFPVFPALLCGVAAVYCLSRYLEASRPRLLFLAGLLTGLATTYRHDSGFYLCLTIAATLGYAKISRILVLPSLTRLAATYFTGLLLIVLPVLAWMLLRIPWHDLYFDLLYMPGYVYPRVRNLPFPGWVALARQMRPFGEHSLYALQERIVYFPILACLTAWISLLGSARLFPLPWKRATFAALTLLGSLLYVKGLVRVTELHQMQAIVLASSLTLILWANRGQLPCVARAATNGCAIVLLAYCGLLLWHAGTFLRWNVRDLVRPHYHESVRVTCHPPPGLERARCLVVDQATIQAVETIQRLTRPDDLIYVGAGRHDKLAINDVRLYFVSGRASVTKWYDLHPGVQTTLPIQQEMIASLQATPPKVIVLNNAWDDNDEPNASGISSGVTVLDDYLRTHYSAESAFGPYTILVPRQAAGSDSK